MGGATIGYISSDLGRRLAELLARACGGALAPAYVFGEENLILIAPVFFEQFFIGGVQGPVM